MAAEIFEQITARLHGFVHIETLYRTSRTGYQSIRERKYNRRPIIQLGKTGSNNPDNSLVPFGIIYDNRFSFLEIGLLFQQTTGLLGNFLIELFTVFVILIDIVALLHSCRSIFRHQ